MRYRSLGRTGLSLSEVGYGAWGIGGSMWIGATEDESVRALHRAIELGVNFIDTARGYGESERIVGRVVREHSGEGLVVATKVPPKNGIWPAPQGVDPAETFPGEHIRASLETSLRASGLDSFDILQFHVWSDEWVGRGDWLETIQSLKQEGKIRHFGVSINDYQPENAIELVHSGQVDTVQVIYNIFHQTPEERLLPACADRGVGVIVRVPLDEGGLTGRIASDSTFPDGDFRNRYFGDGRAEQVQRRIDALTDDLGIRHDQVAETALRYILGEPAVSTVIVGMRNIDNVAANAAASDAGPLPGTERAALAKHRWERNFYQFVSTALGACGASGGNGACGGTVVAGAPSGGRLPVAAGQFAECARIQRPGHGEIGCMTQIDGEVAPGFEPVRAAFLANFQRGLDVGAALCVYRNGEKVVDLWGGAADRDAAKPWQRDTLQLVYSATKGATSCCAHLLAERGELDLDAPVAEYWPEFAAEGKASIPVRQLLSHRAGLPVLDRPLPVDEVLRWDPMVEALAAQRPVWEPGTAHGYHGRTFGWLVGEVIRRVSGRSPGRFFAEEIAGPFGIDWFIGLPEAERGRLSRMVRDRAQPNAPIPLEQIPAEFRDVMSAMQNPESLWNRAFALTEPDLDFDDPAVHAAEIPSSNGICTARALARLYAALIGEVDGIRILKPDTVTAATAEQASGVDRVLMMPNRFASGFMLPTEMLPLGGRRSFGHPGRGGSLGFANPATGIAFGYVPSRIVENSDDRRAADLLRALDSALS